MTPASGWMVQVLLALVPGAGVLVWFFGPGVLFNLAVAGVAALVVEAAMAWVRGRAAWGVVSDGSGLVAAAIFALALPPLLPWWITATGAALGLILGKHLYGGLGDNVFNPAMVGYAAVLLAFPLEMSLWPAPQPWPWQEVAVDALTHATPLDRVAMEGFPSLPDAGWWAGAAAAGVWAWVAGGFLAGGLWLVFRGIADWRFPAGVLAGVTAAATLLWAAVPGAAPPDFHLLAGATVFVAFFIATDPVTAPASRGGRLLFAGGIGILAVVIREWGAFPDGFAFAVLIMNAAAPLMDHWAHHHRAERS